MSTSWEPVSELAAINNTLHRAGINLTGRHGVEELARRQREWAERAQWAEEQIGLADEEPDRCEADTLTGGVCQMPLDPKGHCRYTHRHTPDWR